MEIFKSILLISLFALLTAQSCYAQKNKPPEPPQIRPLAGDVTPPSGPINSNLFVLALAGTVLGLHHIYKYKKRPA